MSNLKVKTQLGEGEQQVTDAPSRPMEERAWLESPPTKGPSLPADGTIWLKSPPEESPTLLTEGLLLPAEGKE